MCPHHTHTLLAIPPDRQTCNPIPITPLLSTKWVHGIAPVTFSSPTTSQWTLEPFFSEVLQLYSQESRVDEHGFKKGSVYGTKVQGTRMTPRFAENTSRARDRVRMPERPRHEDKTRAQGRMCRFGEGWGDKSQPHEVSGGGLTYSLQLLL